MPRYRRTLCTDCGTSLEPGPGGGPSHCPECGAAAPPAALPPGMAPFKPRADLNQLIPGTGGGAPPATPSAAPPATPSAAPPATPPTPAAPPVAPSPAGPLSGLPAGGRSAAPPKASVPGGGALPPGLLTGVGHAPDKRTPIAFYVIPVVLLLMLAFVVYLGYRTFNEPGGLPGAGTVPAEPAAVEAPAAPGSPGD